MHRAQAAAAATPKQPPAAAAAPAVSESESSDSSSREDEEVEDKADAQKAAALRWPPPLLLQFLRPRCSQLRLEMDELVLVSTRSQAVTENGMADSQDQIRMRQKGQPQGAEPSSPANRPLDAQSTEKTQQQQQQQR